MSKKTLEKEKMTPDEASNVFDSAVRSHFKTLPAHVRAEFEEEAKKANSK